MKTALISSVLTVGSLVGCLSREAAPPPVMKESPPATAVKAEPAPPPSEAGVKASSSEDAGGAKDWNIEVIERETSTRFQRPRPEGPCQRILECRGSSCRLTVLPTSAAESSTACRTFGDEEATFILHSVRTAEAKGMVISDVQISPVFRMDRGILGKWCQVVQDSRAIQRETKRIAAKRWPPLHDYYQLLETEMLEQKIFVELEAGLAPAGFVLSELHIEKVGRFKAAKHQYYDQWLAPLGIRRNTVIPYPNGTVVIFRQR